MHLYNIETYMIGETKQIVNQAIGCLGKGKKGLAIELGKDPSLISRYANGTVRPKAETLIKCMEIIEEDTRLQPNPSITSDDLIHQVINATSSLSPTADTPLIHTLYNVLKLANKL